MKFVRRTKNKNISRSSFLFIKHLLGHHDLILLLKTSLVLMEMRYGSFNVSSMSSIENGRTRKTTRLVLPILYVLFVREFQNSFVLVSLSFLRLNLDVFYLSHVCSLSLCFSCVFSSRSRSPTVSLDLLLMLNDSNDETVH